MVLDKFLTQSNASKGSFKPPMQCAQAFRGARAGIVFIIRSFVTLTPEILIPREKEYSCSGKCHCTAMTSRDEGAE